MASSSTSSAIYKGSQEYPYPSHVNAASFLSIKLSSKTNYDRWKEQMMCLVKSHDMLDFIHGTSRPPPLVSVDEARKWERSDTLVKGWILGSLSEDVMVSVVGLPRPLDTANDVWKKLKTTYSPRPVRSITPEENENRMRCAPLYRAILEANWDAAEPYLAYQLNVWNAKLNDEGNTALHLAIGTCKNDKFFNEVLDKITSNIRAHNIALNIVNKILPKKANKIVDNITYDLAWIIAGIIDHNIAVSIDDDIAESIVEIIAPNRDENIAHNRASNRARKIASSIANNIASNRANNIAPNRANNIAQNIAHNIANNIVKLVDIAHNRANKREPMSLQDLVSDHRWNALHQAAAVGNIKAAKMLVEKNPHLLFKFNDKQYLPIHFSLFSVSALHKTIFRFLLKASKDHIELSKEEGYHNPFEGRQGVVLLNRVINAGFMEVAYELINAYPAMATADYYHFDTPLETIAKKFDLYYSQSIYQRIFDQTVAKEFRAERRDVANQLRPQRPNYENPPVAKELQDWRPNDQPQDQRQNVPPEDQDERHDIENPDPQLDEVKDFPGNEVKDNKPLLVLRIICNEVRKLGPLVEMRAHYMEAATLAVRHDIPEALEEISRHFPEAIWAKHEGFNLIELAIINRCRKVYYYLVHEMTDNKFSLKIQFNKDGNNLLHLAGKLATVDKLNEVPGAALQMQRELQWFKEVEKFVFPEDKEAKNNDEDTPMMVFIREHEKLRKQGEEWMKKTADSYTITAALIITIVFAAAITVPGGNDGTTGKAIYATKPSFIIFAVSDAISLFTSTTSLLLFLSILTARYQLGDFLYRLPKRLILGLVMLFLSVTSMMVAFSATLYIMFGQ